MPVRVAFVAHLFWLSLAVESAYAHVPTYEAGCTYGCCSPPRHHDTSQVIYRKGSGGLEVHIESLSDPFPLEAAIMDGKADEAVLDFDVVFRDPVDPTTFSLYVGCGGCMPSDPLLTPPVPFSGSYQTGLLEPFTQTRYFSLFPKQNRTFGAAALRACYLGDELDAHWSIRLVDHANRSDGGALVWGAVVGLGERFTAQELVEFPVYILNNHGPAWNEMEWTWWLSLFVLAPLVFELLRRGGACCGGGKKSHSLLLFRLRDEPPHKALHASHSFLALEWLYAVAAVGYIAAILEQSIHLFYSQSYVPLGHEFAVGLFLVVLLPNGLMLAFARRQRLVFLFGADLRIWRSCVVAVRLYCCRIGVCCGGTEWPAARAVGSLLFAAGAVAGSFFLLGAGFYIGPSALLLALLLHASTSFSAQEEEPRSSLPFLKTSWASSSSV